jgi:serine/threonine-protein kinase
MPLNPGARLGPYEVISALGAGGMGEVYKARDTRLDRIVAVKVLPASLAEDPEFRHRFDREARTISQLTHPHICTLYDVGDGFLVMEYLEGETLADRLQRGQLPVNEAVRIAMQIAEALDQAHRAGIVHRDLKPGNVMLTKGGAKLLDFGLAKPGVTHGFAARATAATARDATPTMTTPPNITGQGAILGTIQYMAPEVLEGGEADARSDIFAFGCVLYEMLTGRKAFTGKSQVSLIGAILKDTPTPIAARAELPPALVWLVGRCLAKNPDERRQSAAGVVSQLEWIAETGGAPVPAPIAQRSWRSAALGAGVVSVLGVAAAAMIWALRPDPVVPRPTRFKIAMSSDKAIATFSPQPDLAISPDGSYLVYLSGDAANGSYQVRRFDQLDSEPLGAVTPTANLSGPVLSPDSQWLAFGGVRDFLFKVPIAGGAPVALARVLAGSSMLGLTWPSDGRIVFATTDRTTGLMTVPSDGGEPEVLTTPDRQNGEADHILPFVLPENRGVLFTVERASGLAEFQVAVLDMSSRTWKVLIERASQAVHTPTGHIVFAAEGGLRAVRFDLERLAMVGTPVTVVDQVATKESGAADFSIAANGTLVYAPTRASNVGGRRTMVWVNRQGVESPIDGLPARAYMVARLSPDGGRLALDIRDQQNDIWTWELRFRTLTRVTLNPGQDMFPVWSPDGQRIFFSSSRGGGSPNLFVQAADGTGDAERLTTSTTNQLTQAIDPAGTRLLFRETGANPIDINMLTLDGKPERTALLQGEYVEDNATVSPDGRWVAYESTESGRQEVYVRSFPDVSRFRIQISPNGGTKPVWSPNGRELFYLDGQQNMMLVPVRSGNVFERDSPQQLFSAGAYFATQVRNFDIARDGQRFLMIKELREAAEAQPEVTINVVLNWFEELKQRVGN